MGRQKDFFYGKKTKKKVIEDYFNSSASMNELAKIHGILGSNTVSDWIRKYGHLNKKNVQKPMEENSKSEKSKAKSKRQKRQRSYEQLQISSLEIDIDETRQKLEFYKCALSVINELAQEVTGTDFLKKTGEQLSIRRAKRKS